MFQKISTPSRFMIDSLVSINRRREWHYKEFDRKNALATVLYYRVNLIREECQHTHEIYRYKFRMSFGGIFGHGARFC